jgi:hypothetical protein
MRFYVRVPLCFPPANQLMTLLTITFTVKVEE